MTGLHLLLGPALLCSCCKASSPVGVRHYSQSSLLCRSQEGSAGVSNPDLKISLSPVDIPDLDLDDFMGYLTNDRELNPDESDHLKSLFSGRLLGIDSPLPSLGGSRQGSALQSGRLQYNLQA